MKNETPAVPKAGNLGFRVGAVAIAALTGIYVLWGVDAIAYPYRLVRMSFEITNAWAVAAHGEWLKRALEASEVVSLAWVGLLCVVAWSVISGAEKGKAGLALGGAALVLVVALLPMVAFMWALVVRAGWPSVHGAAAYFSGG